MSSPLPVEPPLGQADLEALARFRAILGDRPRLALAPTIPAAKAWRARRTHGASLPEGEPLLVLHDQTLLGRGDEGFVLTRERLAFRGFWEPAWSCAWADVDVSSVRCESHRLQIGDRGGHLEDRVTLGRLVEVIRVFGRSPKGPYRNPSG